MKYLIFTIALIIILLMPIFTVYRGGGIPFVPDEKIKCENNVCLYPIKTSLLNYVILKIKGEIYKK